MRHLRVRTGRRREDRFYIGAMQIAASARKKKGRQKTAFIEE